MYSGTFVWAGHAHWQSTTLWKYLGSRTSVGFTRLSPPRPPHTPSTRDTLAVSLGERGLRPRRRPPGADFGRGFSCVSMCVIGAHNDSPQRHGGTEARRHGEA